MKSANKTGKPITGTLADWAGRTGRGPPLLHRTSNAPTLPGGTRRSGNKSRGTIPMAQSQNVLITGAAGGMGKAVVRALAARGHRVTGLDRLASPDVDHSIEADILDRDAVAEAARGQDAIIHLAATPDEADFVDALLEPNVRGLYHVADAARANGVGKLVLASSVQVVTGHALGGGLGRATTLADGPKVINHYALTKLWLEDLGDMYARVYGLAVIACRLGWLPRSPSHAEELAAASGFDVYLSHRDAGRFLLPASKRRWIRTTSKSSSRRADRKSTIASIRHPHASCWASRVRTPGPMAFRSTETAGRRRVGKDPATRRATRARAGGRTRAVRRP